MNITFADRLSNGFQGEFIKKILGAATAGDVISFAGGLPNPASFPINELKEASCKVLDEEGVGALQYSSTQGFIALREWIANRYKKNGVEVSASDILITNGSQQALDILCNVLINEGDGIIIEKPCFLGALTDFNLYNPTYSAVTVNDDGLNIEELKEALKSNSKFLYAVPNFQNPTGLTYSEENRAAIAAAMKGIDTFFVEDNPYGELRFEGTNKTSMFNYLGEQCILLGSFSKIISPGIRLGWICSTNTELMTQLISVKQSVDTHTSIFGQMVMERYLRDNDLDAHIATIIDLYKHQSNTMLSCMEKYFPPEASFTRPEGGMFIWATLPDSIDVLDLFEAASKEKVAFVAGNPFYTKMEPCHSLRLNYTNSSDEVIDKGIKIIGDLIKNKLAGK